MNKKLAELYQQILLNENESSLQKPSNDKAGKLPDELFGKKPEVKGTEGAKDAKVDSAKELKHDVDEEGDVDTNTAKEGDSGEPEKTPSKSADAQYSGGKPRTVVGDSLGAFETLFKKTLFTETEGTEEELGNENDEEKEEENIEEEEKEVGELEAAEEEEGDLLSDLKSLHDRIGEIVSKLESSIEDDSTISDEMNPDQEHTYNDEDFEDEFGSAEGSDEEPKLESVQKKSKLTQPGNNKVGKLKKSGGKANGSVTGADPKLKALGDKKKALLNKQNKVAASKLPKPGNTIFS